MFQRAGPLGVASIAHPYLGLAANLGLTDFAAASFAACALGAAAFLACDGLVDLSFATLGGAAPVGSAAFPVSVALAVTAMAAGRLAADAAPALVLAEVGNHLARTHGMSTTSSNSRTAAPVAAPIAHHRISLAGILRLGWALVAGDADDRAAFQAS